MRSWLRVIGVGLIALASACSPGAAGTEVPTQVLDFASPTPSVTPAPPTPTLPADPVLGVDDLVTSVPADLAALDAEQQRMAQLAIADATDIAGTAAGLRVAYIQAMRWPGPTLSCDTTTASIEDTLRAGVDGYHILLTTGATVYDYRADRDQQVLRCNVADLGDITGQTLVLIDPAAAEMAEMARQRIARQLDVPARRVRLVDIRAVTWDDTSLGCPVAGQTYIEGPVAGYRLVVAAADTEYVFHSDFDRLMLCQRADD